MNEDFIILLSFRKQYTTYWASRKHNSLIKEGQMVEVGLVGKRSLFATQLAFLLGQGSQQNCRE